MEERLSLGPKKMLFLVECEGRKFLIATGADTIVTMTEVRSTEKRRKAENA
jgi:flagellar biogenesis protein FliO